MLTFCLHIIAHTHSIHAHIRHILSLSVLSNILKSHVLHAIICHIQVTHQPDVIEERVRFYWTPEHYVFSPYQLTAFIVLPVLFFYFMYVRYFATECVICAKKNAILSKQGERLKLTVCIPLIYIQFIQGPLFYYFVCVFVSWF